MLEPALNALLGALGRPRAALVRSGDDIAARIDATIEDMGLAARAADPARPLPDAAGALLQDRDGQWLALIARPGAGRFERLAEDGASHPLAGEAEGARAAIVIDVVSPPQLKADPAGFFSRNLRLVVPILLGGFLTNAMLLVLPLYGAFVYDKVLGNGAFETLWAVTIGALLGLTLEFSARILRVQLVERIAVSTDESIDAALYRNILAKTGGQPSIGLVLDKYKQILASRDFLSSAYLLAVADIPFLLLFLAAIALVAGPLVLSPLLCGLAVVFLNLAAAVPARRYEALARAAGESRISILAEVLGFRETVVTTLLRHDLGRRWRSLSDSAAIASGRARYWNSLALAVNGSAYGFAYVGILVGGAYLVEERVLTSGGILAATMLTSRAMATIASVVLLSTRYREFRRALAELDALLPAVASPDQPPRPQGPTGEIRLRALSWQPDPAQKAALDGLNLAFKPGEIVGIAGLPGAGKTTLLRLIAGAERASGGEILLDMLPVDRWNRRQLAGAIGYKAQEAMLFDGSVEFNVRAGNEAAAAPALRDALDCSGLLAAIERGEMALSTEVGPRGGRISGGQRQMVALARAFLGDPAILLLDEPTVGLDSQSEQKLADYLAGLAGRRTVLVSSHSRAILGVCSRIIVLQGGRIAADGPRERILVG